jgi:hypothetical protein
LEQTLWFVPRSEHIDDLVRDGVHRGRIWTAAELKDLLSVSGLTEQDLVALSRLKQEFDGEVLTVANEITNELPPDEERDPHTCRACGMVRYWISVHGPKVCAMCHPPASPKLMDRWIDGDDEAAS